MRCSQLQPVANAWDISEALTYEASFMHRGLAVARHALHLSRVFQEVSPLTPALPLAALLALTSSPGAVSALQQPRAQCCTATIRVRVPDGTGTVYLAGSLPQLGPWRADGLVMTGTGR